MALALARLLTGFFDEDRALDAFEQLSDQDVYSIVATEQVSPFEFLDFLATSIASNEKQNAAATLLARVRNAALLPRGQELLKLSFPSAAKEIIEAFFATPNADDLLLEAIAKVVRPIETALLSSTPAVSPVETTRVMRQPRPKLDDKIFSTISLSPIRTDNAADFLIGGLYSDDDSQVSNVELFQSLTRQTLSGVSMTFEAQFKRHFAWRVCNAKNKASRFEEILERLESDSQAVFNTPQGVPRGWPGWSPLGGVMLPFEVYLERVYDMRFSKLDTLLKRLDLKEYASTAEKVFYELRALWVLRHMAFVQENHTYATLKPTLDRIEADLKRADLKPASLDERHSLKQIVPPSVLNILSSRIPAYDRQGRYFTDFAGLGGGDPLQTLVKLPYLAMARILRSSPDRTFEDPVFTQVVARDISSRLKQLVASQQDTVADAATTTRDVVANLNSVYPTVLPYLTNGRTQSGLTTLERNVFSFSSTSVTSSLKASLAERGYDPEALWFVEPMAMTLRAVQPFGTVQTTGAYASVRRAQAIDPNMGYAISVLADLVSSQTYFVDALRHPVQLQGPLTSLDAFSVFPAGLADAAQKLVEMQQALAIATPMDNIESTVARLQSVCGNRVDIVSEKPGSAPNLVTLDAEHYSVMDFLHSAYTNYYTPFGRTWAWLRHSMMRRGVELLKDDRLFGMAQQLVANTDLNGWAWQLANGTPRSLRRVYRSTRRLYEQTVANNRYETARFSVDRIDDLPEDISSGVHPASLLMAFISGDLQDETMAQATRIYNETTAPLMSFIINYRLSDVAIADLALDTFTDGVVFETLKDLTKAMIQRVDSELATMAERTPLGKFVVAAARGVGQKIALTDETKTQMDELQQQRQDAEAVLLEIIHESDNSESYQQRIRQQRQALYEATQQLKAFRSQSKRSLVALWPGGSQAIRAIEQQDMTLRLGREYTVPVYTLLPRETATSAVSDDFVQTPSGLMVQMVDSIFVGTKAQKQPNLFADEVERLVLLIAEQTDALAAVSAVSASSLKETLKEACRSVFSLGALLSGAETVGPVVDAARKLLTNANEAGPSDTDELPLRRLYIDEPFDYTLDSIANLCKRLLKDLRQALEHRLKLRTPGSDGLTPMEKIRTGQLGPLTLKRPKEIHPIVYNWVNSQARPSTGPFRPIVFVNQNAKEAVGQSITTLRPSVGEGVPIEFAEALAFIYDRLVSGIQPRLLNKIYNIAKGNFYVEGKPSQEADSLVLAAQALPEDIAVALRQLQPNPAVLPTLAQAVQWYNQNPLIASRLDRWLKTVGYWRSATLGNIQAGLLTGRIPVVYNPLAVIDTIVLTRAVNLAKFMNVVNMKVKAKVRLNDGPAFQSNLPTADTAQTASEWLIEQANQGLAVAIRELVEPRENLSNFVLEGDINISTVTSRPSFTDARATGSLSDAMSNLTLFTTQNEKVLLGTTNIARYAMWSNQVETMVAFCNQSKYKRIDASLLLWPWTNDMFVDEANSNTTEPRRGISRDLVAGKGWVPQNFYSKNNLVANTVAMMLLRELDVVKAELGANIWDPELETVTVVDSIMGNITGSVSIPFYVPGTKKKKLTFNTWGQHCVRVYTQAPTIIQNQTDNALLLGLNGSTVAHSLVQVRKNALFQTDFDISVTGTTKDRWEALPEWRQMAKFTTPKKPVKRYAYDDFTKFPRHPEQIYRQIQSTFTALHTVSVIDECELIDNRGIGEILEPEDEKDLILTLEQPAVLVAGMLRATEPLVVRLDENHYGVWVERNDESSPYVSVLGKRIEEMFDYVNNTTDRLPKYREKKRIYDFYGVNKHTLVDRPADGWLDAANAMLNDVDIKRIDFSNYSHNDKIVESYAVLTQEQLKAFWQIVNRSESRIIAPGKKVRNRLLKKSFYKFAIQGPQYIRNGESEAGPSSTVASQQAQPAATTQIAGLENPSSDPVPMKGITQVPNEDYNSRKRSGSSDSQRPSKRQTTLAQSYPSLEPADPDTYVVPQTADSDTAPFSETREELFGNLNLLPLTMSPEPADLEWRSWEVSDDEEPMPSEQLDDLATSSSPSPLTQSSQLFGSLDGEVTWG